MLNKTNLSKIHNAPGVPKIAFIGYTNVGKSMLINALFKNQKMASKNRLF